MAKFQPGKSGNPNGRPKGSISKVDLFLPAKLDAVGLDWAKVIKDYIDSLQTTKEKFDVIMQLLPRLAVNLEMAPLEMTGLSTSPEGSVENAKAAFDAMKEAAQKAAEKPKDKPGA